MLRVGLTGNVASGKSSVAERWRERGATVIDADVLAREAVAPGTDGLRRIRAQWGDEIIDERGGLDRAALRRIVFADDAARSLLEGIVHPEVARLRAEREREAAERGEPLVVHEIPLLFEVGLEGEFDAIVLVDAPPELRRQRLMLHRGLTADEAQRMINAQMPAERKRERADHVIRNSADLDTLRAEADRVLDALRAGSD